VGVIWQVNVTFFEMVEIILVSKLLLHKIVLSLSFPLHKLSCISQDDATDIRKDAMEKIV